jgi:hypothetical protein
MERPVVKKATTRTSAAKIDPRERIIWRLSELQTSIAGALDTTDAGDSVHRVLEHASLVIASGARDFATENQDSSLGLHEMVEAEAFVQASSALAQKEANEYPGMKPRAQNLSRLVKEMDEVTEEMDKYCITAHVAQRAKATTSPTVPAPEAVSDSYLDAVNAIHNHAGRAIGVLQMMTVLYGGEIEDENRPADADLQGLFVFLRDAASGIMATANKGDHVFTASFWSAAHSAWAISNTLDSIIADFESEIPLGRLAMAELVDAMLHSFKMTTAALADQKEPFTAGATR